MRDSRRTRAVVCGGSVAGLLAARVLTERYDDVLIVERDVLPAGPSHRRGVPQDRHIHGIVGRGQAILDELFPGFVADLTARGVPVIDQLGQARVHLNGHRLRRARSGIEVLSASRLCLEDYLRQRVLALPRITLLEETSALGFTTTPDHRAVIGARITRSGLGGKDEVLQADLVIDATGRGTRTPYWLADLGYPSPESDALTVNVAYSTAVWRLPDDALAGDRAVIAGPRPGVHRGGALAAIEGDRYIVTLIGMLGESPPDSPDGFVEYAHSLEVPSIAEALADAVLLEGPVRTRFPTSLRHRYDRMRRFPTGLLVVGDALASFNPIYGQGISVAALQAHTLQDQLRRGRALGTQSVMRALTRATNNAWDAAAGADLAFPEVAGQRDLKQRLGSSYVARLHAAAADDSTLGTAFLRVAAMLDPPQSLFRPAVSVPVLAHALRGPRSKDHRSR